MNKSIIIALILNLNILPAIANYDEDLVRAAYKADVQTVEQLLEKDIDIKTPGLLFNAVLGGSAKIVELLFNKGADPNDKDSIAFITAAANGPLEMIELFLEKGANLNAQDFEALIQAARTGKIEIVELLLENGADPSAQNNRAIQQADLWGYPEIVRLLIRYGANGKALWTNETTATTTDQDNIMDIL